MSTSLDQQLRELRHAILHRPPYFSGTVPVHKDELVVYYSKGEVEEARRINLGAASPASLEHLSKTCDVATFGRNDEDVIDESYRKAGKLDTSEFAVKLDLEKIGLMDIVRGQLLDGSDVMEGVYAELYKLNVYGEGSFFKAHRDTPRGKFMFGSLVIIYPTAHEGGSLILREKNDEWTFDSAEAVKTGAQVGPCVAYITFFSDVEHEVTPVLSGHRVTVTYNLYFEDSRAPLKASTIPKPGSRLDMPNPSSTGLLVFKPVLEKLLEDSSFLPDGGYLGFGLQRVYPLERSAKPQSILGMGDPKARLNLSHLKRCLKGSDADVLHACTMLGLQTSLWMLYSDDDGYEDLSVIVPRDPAIEGDTIEEDYMLEQLARKRGAKRIPFVDVSGSDEEGKERKKHERCRVDWDMEVHWVTKPDGWNVVKNSVMVYGNQAELGYKYGYISMIVEVGKPGERSSIAADSQA